MALGVQFLVLCQAKFPSFSLPDSVDTVARRGELRRMATAIALHRKNYAGCLLGLRGLRFQYWIPLRAGSWLPRDIRWYFHFLRPHHVQRCCHHRHSVHAVLPHDEAFLQRILIYFTIFLCSFSLSLFSFPFYFVSRPRCCLLDGLCGSVLLPWALAIMPLNDERR